jgi:hypothetical protein
MAKRMDLGLPDKLELRNHGSGIEIIRKWFGWQTLLLTGFAVFWNFFLFSWFSIATAFGGLFASFNNPVMSIFTLIPLIHVGAGVGMAYAALAGWINTTRIRVDQGRISVRHGPLPWLGNKDLDGSDLKQLYSKEKITRGRNSTTIKYEVHALTANGKNQKLVSGLESSEQALYIEQEIERYFRIEDTPVRGQIE